MTDPNKKLELSFTDLVFYDSVVISTVKEDVIIAKEQVNTLIDVCLEHFDSKDFVYITNRKFNYNVNPVIYRDLVNTNNLKGIAVVSDNLEKLKTANFEKNFSPVPYELFNLKEEAMSWANSLVATS